MPKSLRSPRHQRLTALLIEARRQQGHTQAELAAKLDKPQSYVAKVEGGERRLDVIEFIDFADALGLGIDAFLGRVREG